MLVAFKQTLTLRRRWIMKITRKLLTIAVMIPVLTLLPFQLKADGEGDVPHGMPGVYDETIVRTGMRLNLERLVEEESAETSKDSQLVFNPLEGLWAHIDWIMGAMH
jgi:hypothetical protein